MRYRIEIGSEEAAGGQLVGARYESFEINSDLPVPLPALRSIAQHACRHKRLPMASLVETDDGPLAERIKADRFVPLYSWLTD